MLWKRLECAILATKDQKPYKAEKIRDSFFKNLFHKSISARLISNVSMKENNFQHKNPTPDQESL